MNYISFHPDNGEIYKIAPHAPLQKETYICVKTSEVVPILTAKYPVLYNYHVVYDEKAFQYVLKKKDAEIAKDKSLGKLFNIPNKNSNASVQIMVDKVSKQYIVKINKTDAIKIYEKKLLLSKIFSVTAENNPFILYETFTVYFNQDKLQSTYKIPITDLDVYTKKNFSIFTKKQFSSYSYKIK